MRRAHTCTCTQDAVAVLGEPYGTHQLLRFKSGPVFVVVGSGLAAPGYTLVADEAVSGELMALLVEKVGASSPQACPSSLP